MIYTLKMIMEQEVLHNGIISRFQIPERIKHTDSILLIL